MRNTIVIGPTPGRSAADSIDRNNLIAFLRRHTIPTRVPGRNGSNDIGGMILIVPYSSMICAGPTPIIDRI